MALPTNIVTQFSNLIRYSISSYLDDYVSFIKDQRIDITNYYLGNSEIANETSFSQLNSLLKQSSKINELIEVHKGRMNNPEFWDLIITLSEIEESLYTIENSSKWLRSIITKNNFSPDVEIETTLIQMQTIEQLASKLGSNNVENDWVKIALRNDLREEDYTPDGGVSLITSYRNKLSIKVQSVVDNIRGEKIYGIDLDRVISFEEDDIKALTYKDTVFQSVDVLAQLRSGQTPEFPLDGIQVNLISGSSKSSISYPVLFRQITETFSKDDTLKSLLIKNIENKEDSLIIEFEVETRFGEAIPIQTSF